MHILSHEAVITRKQFADCALVLQCGLNFPSSPESEVPQMPAEAHARLSKLGYVLPDPPKPGANYIPAKTVGRMVYLAGAISKMDGAVVTGTVGAGRTTEEGYAAKQHLGSLDKIKQIVTVNGYVNAVAGFEDSPKVINGASDLLIELFGEAGRHVRAAIGVSALPHNALVELQMTVELES
jgi:enamine deaminase RidA (YjgF/YER057c/UK114 family)